MSVILAFVYLICVLVLYAVTLSKPQSTKVCTMASVTMWLAGLVLSTMIVV